MTEKFLVVLAAFGLFSLQSSFARAGDSYPTDLERRCALQEVKMQTLERDREQREAEIYHLRDEIRRLNETLNNIRSQIGDNEPRPSLR
ncbi:MAG: hypothetical protein ACKVQA_23220 [Burkholderiales bacterium]